jgi:hypothetical protein
MAGIPASTVARVAEWSLGDEIQVVAYAHAVDHSAVVFIII